jgi:Cu/Ag efflux protein CusF
MRPHIFAVVMTLALLGGCATQKPAGRMENVTEARLLVTAIDVPQRRITLKDQDGKETIVTAGEQVKNLEQVSVGDEVVVSYTEALAWQVKPAGQGAPGISADEGVTSAKPGEKPARSAGRSVMLTATITEIDLTNGTVTLTGPEGNPLTFKARDPANLKKVQVGDLVDITYSEALAIAVRPVNKKK